MRARNAQWKAKRPDYPAAYRAANSDAMAAATQRWRVRNPEKVKEQSARRVRLLTPERQEYNRNYHLAHKAQAAANKDKKRDREYAAKWRDANPERHAENRRRWNEANRDKLRAKDAKRRSSLWAKDNMSKHDRLAEPFQPSLAI